MLLVEDDEDHVFLIRRALRDLDDIEVDLDVISDGEDAVRHLSFQQDLHEEAQPQLVVLDLRIPKVSGVEVLRWIRASDGLGRVPVVVLTSSEHDDDSRVCWELGANDYICKPLDGARLRAEVQAMARRWTEKQVSEN
jgi:DNA-binding response OmpR family regulator